MLENYDARDGKWSFETGNEGDWKYPLLTFGSIAVGVIVTLGLVVALLF